MAIITHPTRIFDLHCDTSIGWRFTTPFLKQDSWPKTLSFPHIV